jgi:hypothetical protein
MALDGININTGQTGGYESSTTSTTKTTIIATVDDLYKMTGWIWAGSTANQLDTKKCLSKSAVTQSTYNQIKIASGTSTTSTTKTINLISFDTPSSGYTNNRLIRRDDILISKIVIAIESRTSGLTLNPDPYNLRLYLTSSSTSTAEVKNLCTFYNIDNKKNNVLVSYFTLNLPNYLESPDSIFSRDAYLCATLSSDWSNARWISFGTNGNYIVKKSTSQVKNFTANLGIKWRDFIRNGCRSHVKIGNTQANINTWG